MALDEIVRTEDVDDALSEAHSCWRAAVDFHDHDVAAGIDVSDRSGNEDESPRIHRHRCRSGAGADICRSLDDVMPQPSRPWRSACRRRTAYCWTPSLAAFPRRTHYRSTGSMATAVALSSRLDRRPLIGQCSRRPRHVAASRPRPAAKPAVVPNQSTDRLSNVPSTGHSAIGTGVAVPCSPGWRQVVAGSLHARTAPRPFSPAICRRPQDLSHQRRLVRQYNDGPRWRNVTDAHT